MQDQSMSPIETPDIRGTSVFTRDQKMNVLGTSAFSRDQNNYGEERKATYRQPTPSGPPALLEKVNSDGFVRLEDKLQTKLAQEVYSCAWLG